MEQIIQEIRSLEERIFKLRSELRKHKDGFIYLVCIRCYGSVSHQTYTNTFLVQEICDQYHGDNGIVDVYTTNPNPGIDTYGEVHIMSLEELQNVSQKNISMSEAIVNWIARK